MIMEVYAVYDKAVGNFLPPTFVRARGEVLRAFAEACNDEKSPFCKHASDYYLAYLGKWDDSSGVFSGDEPTRVIGAIELQDRSNSVVDDIFVRSSGAAKVAM